MRNKLVRAFAVLVFAVGVLVAMVLAGVIVWGDLEASRFDYIFDFGDRLTTLDCPVMMTTEEVGTISASFTNPLENPIEPTVRTHISQGSATLMREDESKITLAPGETQRLEWEVTREDAAYDRLILARVRLYAKRPLGSREAACGILVVNLPLSSGNTVYYLALAITVLGMGGGAGLWIISNRPMKGAAWPMIRAMGALAGCVLAALIAGLLGQWLLGLFLLVVTVLLVGSVIGYFVNRLG